MQKATRTFYNLIVAGYEADETTAVDYARGFDFSDCDTTESTVSYLNYIDTVDGVTVYYCYGTDSYLYAVA